MAAVWTELHSDSFRRIPWKNAGGVSIDVAAEFDGGATEGDWSSLVWRFGATSIPHPGPFSDMTGFDRILTPIRGHGLSLASADGLVIDAGVPLVPVRFDGGLALISRLEAGQVDVVNLMCRRRSVAGDVTVLMSGARTRVEAIGVAILYAPAGPAVVVVDGETRDMQAGHALRRDGGVGSEVLVREGVVLLATIRRRTT